MVFLQHFIFLIFFLFSISSFADVATERQRLLENARKVQTLGLKITRKLLPASQNLFISPLSIAEALATLFAGAEGRTKTETAQFLGIAPDRAFTEYGDIWKKTREAIQAQDPKVDLLLANSVWTNADLEIELLPEFTKYAAKAHETRALSVPFSKPSTVNLINDWASQNTNGMIPKILNSPIPREAVFYLANALYFNGKWSVAFKTKETREEDFKREEASVKKVKMMRGKGSFRYAETEDLQVVRLPFGAKRVFAAYFLLPKNGQPINQLIEELGLEFTSLFRTMSTEKGTVYIPRFELEYTASKLEETLKSFGVVSAFSSKEADFRNLLKNPSGEPTKLDRFIHTAKAKFTEAGAEFAAVTVGRGITATSADDGPFIFRADHPFAVVIMHDPTEMVLALGVVHDPKNPE